MEREIDPYNIEALVHRIYREDAPYEFMPRYRLDYLAPLESCPAKHPKDQRTLNLGYPDGSDGRDLDRIEDALYGCEAVLLEEEPFEGFTEEFTAYVSGVAKAFDLIRNDDSVAHQVLEATRETAWETWYVFAGGVRILEKGHDACYNGRLVRWKQDYLESLAALAPKVRDYNRYVRESTAAAGVPPRQPEERGKRFLSSLGDGYLSGW